MTKRVDFKTLYYEMGLAYCLRKGSYEEGDILGYSLEVKALKRYPIRWIYARYGNYARVYW